MAAEHEQHWKIKQHSYTSGLQLIFQKFFNYSKTYDIFFIWAREQDT